MTTTVGFYWTPSGAELEKQIALLVDTGANAVFVPYSLVEQAPLQELRRRQIRVFVDWRLFAGEDLRQRFPDSLPIDAAGKAFARDGWYVPVCPNHPQVRAAHLAAIGRLLDRRGKEIDGLWLDFIRYPVRWEAEQPRLQQLCFCRHCLNLFLHEQRVAYSPVETRAIAAAILQERRDEWVDWKCACIAQFVQAVRAELAARDLPIQLGMFSLPWRRSDHDGAIRTVAGQDLGQLAATVDTFSPMVYHQLCYRPASWIAEVVEEVRGWTKQPVLPIIQSLDQPAPMPPAELDAALGWAFATPSAGVMIFTLEPLLASPDKAAVVRRWFRTVQ
jgi:hypothetical protein